MTPIETERLTLRRLTPEHADFIRTLVNEGRDKKELHGGRAIERVATGQYL